MARLSKETIDEIYNRIDVVDVISGYLSLKKKGKDYWAPCPFHNEKSPSFAVAPAKGIFKCFGCGEAGGPVDFVMKMDGLSYIEALKHLANKYGIEIKEDKVSDTQVQEQNVRDSLYIVLNYAKDFYKKYLIESEEGKSVGVSYFKERGFLDNTVSEFDLGFAPDTWSALTDEALKNGYSLEYLEKSGLTIVKPEENKKYDRFRGRVIFPIHNVSGKVVGFGARILKKSEKEPKYINSPESDVYVKSKILYGIFQAKNHIRQLENAYLVEGYTDVISLHQAGIKNAIASSGTSLTVEQIRLVKRFADNITVLYDGDPAGIKASLRGIDLILEEGLNVKAVLLPDQEDPDSYVKKVGASGFKEYVDTHAVHFIEFKISLYKKEIDKDPIRKAEVIRDVVESISKIPDDIKRSVFIKECSRLLQMEEKTLISELNKIILKNRNKGAYENENKPISDTNEPYIPIPELEENKSLLTSRKNQESEIIRLLLNFGSDKVDNELTISQYLVNELADIDFETTHYKTIFEFYQKNESLQVNFIDILNIVPEEFRNEITGMVTQKFEISKNWANFNVETKTEHDVLEKALKMAIYRIKWKYVKEELRKSSEEIQKLTTDEDINAQLEIYMHLKNTEKLIAKILGVVIS
jgi:DNA primase